MGYIASYLGGDQPRRDVGQYQEVLDKIGVWVGWAIVSRGSPFIKRDDPMQRQRNVIPVVRSTDALV